MIYIIEELGQPYEPSYPVRAYQVEANNAEELYKSYMLEKAKEYDLNINPHYVNIVTDYKLHNSHLSAAEYKSKSKQWDKYCKVFNIEKFILEMLKGVEVEFDTVYI